MQCGDGGVLFVGMAYFEDLSPNRYFGRGEGALVSVGWLDEQHAYARGAVSVEFFRALVQLLVAPWQALAFAGSHRCPFCRFNETPPSLYFEGTQLSLGVANLFVPTANRRLFVAPSLIAHYIDAHDYAPPASFQQSVLDCPPMRSAAYLKLLTGHGLLTSKT